MNNKIFQYYRILKHIQYHQQILQTNIRQQKRQALFTQMNNQTSGDNDHNSHCSIVGLLGILIQICLGVLSFSVLIIKRHCQHPKRPWKIWRFDIVKQVVSQLLAHFINLTISLALNQQDPNSDTCLWYFITNIFDNTVGVFLCVFSLRLLQKMLFKKKKYYLISGHYYEIKQNTRKQEIGIQHNQVQQKLQLAPPTIQINYKAWILQLLIWNAIVIVAKVILFCIEYLLQNVLDIVSKFLLGWIQAYPNLQLVAVIVVVPVIMNGLAFWVQDNFLKKRQIPQQADDTPNLQVQLQDQSNKQEFDKNMQLQVENKQNEQYQSTSAKKSIENNNKMKEQGF